MSATSWLYAELTVWQVGNVTSWLAATTIPLLTLKTSLNKLI